MTRRFLKRFKDGSPFDATVDDIQASIQAVACGDKDMAETIKKNLSRGFYTEALPLESNFSKLWSEGE